MMMNTNRNQIVGLREARNSNIDEQLDGPQHLDRLKRVRWSTDFNWSKEEFSMLSNKLRFLFFQIIHIKKFGTKFQLS